MSKRSEQPDTKADIALRKCISAVERTNFVVVAGAGSGKTTSLIKALSSVIAAHKSELKIRRQRIACITYTEIAAEEIWNDVGNNPLVHVSTIHSFLWTLIQPFQSDIRGWVSSRIEEKLVDLRTTAANFGPRVQQRTKDKNRRDTVRLENARLKISHLRCFRYGTGSDYSNGILGHDDILKIATQLLSERRLLRSLLAQQFPFVFVDESQDTTEEVVNGLKSVAAQMKGNFCLGFFGDPMQQIYMSGSGRIVPEDGWVEIDKPENFRCPTTVLSVANAIRSGGDALVQTRGRRIKVNGIEQPVIGTARMFILPANDKREEQVAAVREWVARANNDPSWEVAPDSPIKVLVIVHRMAAIRLGFGNLYSALNDDAPEKIKNGFLDSTSWPLRPFMQFVLPLTNAIAAGREFEAMTVLRTHCPQLRRENAQKSGISKLLTSLRSASIELSSMMSPGSRATVRTVLEHVQKHSMTTLDPRIMSYIEAQDGQMPDSAEQTQDDGDSKEPDTIARFLSCPAAEFLGYNEYIRNMSPFSTQQGIKGTEFEKVLIIADDEEGTHTQFSYDKYLGIRPLSDRDRDNLREGKETQVERTRRLFYVCCTRALTDLAVILFTENPTEADRAVRAMNIFPPEQIFTEV